MARHIHIVKVHHLTLSFPTRKDPDPKPVLDDIDFGIRDGEILGLIGNSGSGKTMTSLAIAGLLPENAEIISGSIKFAGKNLLEMTSKERRTMLGKDIGMIFQEPSTALDPLMTIGRQLEEVLTAHKENSGSKEEITPVTRLDVQRKRFFQLPIDKEQRVKQSSPSKSYPHLELTEM